MSHAVLCLIHISQVRLYFVPYILYIMSIAFVPYIYYNTSIKRSTEREENNMTKFKIENNKIYSTSTLCEKTDIFEIVEKIPVRFFVWNIGENMGTHEYIPVCEDYTRKIKKITRSTLQHLKP